jgi:hypothetical protein
MPTYVWCLITFDLIGIAAGVTIMITSKRRFGTSIP